MPKKTSELARLERKRLVSSLRLRGQSIDAIHYALLTRDPPMLNPQTKKPWSRAVVGQDIKEMTNSAKAELEANHQEHKSRQYGELQEVKRSAWSSGRLGEVLRALQMEMKLLGTEAPLRMDININIVSRLISAIEKTGKDPNPVLEQMVEHLERNNT
jgi:hypothetical protein